MSENRLMFWQRMARHYTTVMGRSAPLYREVCSRIRPHLNRDMNVLELACGTASCLSRCRLMSGSGKRQIFHRI